MSRALLRAACASLLLAGGFAAYLVVAYLLKRPADPEAARELRQALELYGQLLIGRGLLPQLWIALPLSALLARGFPVWTRSRAGAVGALACAAGLAGLLVAATLLRAEWPGAPRVVFTGPGNFVSTWLEMSAGVVAAACVARWLCPSRETRSA